MISKDRNEPWTLTSAWRGPDETEPAAAIRCTPLYVRAGLYYVHVDPASSNIRYNRPCLESRIIQAHPERDGTYTLQLQHFFDFLDTPRAHPPQVFTWEVERQKSYDDMIGMMRSYIRMWRNSGFSSEVVEYTENPPPGPRP